MTDLSYNLQGQGRLVVLLHSFNTDAREWKFIMPELAEHYRVLTYDMRGAGKSPVPVEPTDHLADFEQLFDYLEFEKAILVGHSLGGQVATEFALKHPEKVEKMILLAPGVTGFETHVPFQKMLHNIWNVVPDVDKMLHVLLNSPEAYTIQNALMSRNRAFIIQMHRENLAKSLSWKNLEQVWPESTDARLEDIKADTLFIMGTEENQDIYRIKKLFEKVPAITFAYIEGADHLLTCTHYEELVALVTDFCNQVNGSATFK